VRSEQRKPVGSIEEHGVRIESPPQSSPQRGEEDHSSALLPTHYLLPTTIPHIPFLVLRTSRSAILRPRTGPRESKPLLPRPGAFGSLRPSGSTLSFGRVTTPVIRKISLLPETARRRACPQNEEWKHKESRSPIRSGTDFAGMTPKRRGTCLVFIHFL